MISAEVKGAANVKQEQHESCVNAMKIFILSFANYIKLCKYSLGLK